MALRPVLWTKQVVSISDFSNILTKTAIERLAEADEYEVVREVQVSILLLYVMSSSSPELFLPQGIFCRLRSTSPSVVFIESNAFICATSLWFKPQLLEPRST